MVVEFPGKIQNFGRAEFDAEAAAFATVPINKHLASELASSGRSSLRHGHLEAEWDFSAEQGLLVRFRVPRKVFSISTSILTVLSSAIDVFAALDRT